MNVLLTGRTVLMLESDTFIAGYVGAALIGAGAQLIGPCRTIAEACALLVARARIDVAVIEIADGTDDEWAFCGSLTDRGIPVILLSAPRIGIPAQLARLPSLTRPFAAFQVVDIIAGLVSTTPLAQPVAMPGADL